MTTIREYLEGGNLWDEINGIKPYPFITTELNNLFIMEYGTLPVYSGFVEVPLSTVAGFIVSLYDEKWQAVIDKEVINFLSRESKKGGSTNDTTNDTTTTDNTTNKVSGYNSTSLIDDSGSENNSTNSVTGGSVTTSNSDTLSYNEAFNNLTVLEKLNIVRTAMLDVSNYLKTHVY